MPIIVSRSESSSGDQAKSTYCLSQLRVTFISELPQKPHIILIEQPNIINSIPHHGDAFDAEAERPPAPDFGIIADPLENFGMHHAATGNLQPFLPHLARQRIA